MKKLRIPSLRLSIPRPRPTPKRTPQQAKIAADNRKREREYRKRRDDPNGWDDPL